MAHDEETCRFRSALAEADSNVARLRAEVERLTKAHAEAVRDLNALDGSWEKKYDALRAVLGQLVESSRELEGAYSTRIQNDRHGRTLADEIHLLDRVRATLAAAAALLP